MLYVLFQGGKTSLMLFTMVTILSLYWAIGGFGGIKRVKGKRSLSMEGGRNGQLKAGEQLIVKLELAMPEFIPIPYIVVKEKLQRHTGETWMFEDSLIPHHHDQYDQREIIFQTPALERGKYSFAGTECLSEDIFGIMKHRSVFHAGGEFRILPRTVFIPYWHLHGRNSRLAGPETAVSISRRETTQINGVRDYVYGDRFSRIHWGATAKTGSWKSKEFEHESLQKTVLILDAHSMSYKTAAQFELAVSTTSSLLEYGSRKRMCMGLCTLGQKFRGFAPAEDYLKRQQMIHHLVDISANGSGSHKDKLDKNRDYFPQGAYFILITPLVNDKVIGIMRWAKARRMIPYHIIIGDSNQTDSKSSSYWNSVLQDRELQGVVVSSLTDLPSALGGGR